MNSSIEVTPFALPLSRDAFESALHKGLGRALMHVKRHGAAGLEEIILDACVHDRAYDPQLELTRMPWLMSIVEAADLEHRILDVIVRALEHPRDEFDHWDAQQQRTLAGLFAQRGHKQAHRALYTAFRKCPNSSDWLGDEAIVDLDGADGLLFVIEQMTTEFQKDPEIVLFDSIMRHFDDTHGKGGALKILCSAAEQNELVVAYLAELREDEEDWDRQHLPPSAGGIEENDDKPDKAWLEEQRMRFLAYDAQDAINHVAGVARIDDFSLRRWSLYADAEDIQTLTKALFAETEPKLITQYLEIFSGSLVFPFDARLLALAEHEDEFVRFAALRALGNYCLPSVHTLAVKLLQEKRVGDGVIGLLEYNYLPGDHRLIEAAAPHAQDIHELHMACVDLLTVFEANVTPDALRSLHFAYEHTPCSMCREDAVKLLLRLDALPEWVRDECRHDASEGVRGHA